MKRDFSQRRPRWSCSFTPRETVEGAEGLVEQQHLRLAGESASDSDALSHAARQLAGQRVGKVGEPHIPQKVDDGGVLRSGREFEKREPNVLPRRQPRHEPRLLEHNANIATGSGHSLAPQRQAAVGRPLDPGDDPQQGSLAAARSADQDNSLVLADREINVVERHVLHSRFVVVALGHPGDLKHQGLVLA